MLKCRKMSILHWIWRILRHRLMNKSEKNTYIASKSKQMMNLLAKTKCVRE